MIKEENYERTNQVRNQVELIIVFHHDLNDSELYDIVNRIERLMN
jgi:hypothetical protein